MTNGQNFLLVILKKLVFIYLFIFITLSSSIVLFVIGNRDVL